MKTIFTFLSLSAFLFLTGCANDNNNVDAGGNEKSSVQNLSYSITATYPHDTSSFTQGLVFYKGDLLEGTGNKGKSKLMQIDITTGKPVKQNNLPNEFFGEGVTVLNDTIYQLTWQDKVVLLYSAKDFQKIGEFPLSTEGWGITTNGKELIVSDGSSNLYFYEPSTFRLLRSQGVTEDGSPVSNINELEYINGFVYANRWQYPYILKIDPNSGQVIARMDLTDLINRVQAKIPNLNTGTDATLNGIAIDSTTGKIYITGKYWPELYEIQFEH